MMALLTFLSSNAGGALVGLIIEAMDARRRNKEQIAEAQLQKDLAYHNQLKTHAAQLDKASEAKLHDRKIRFKFWGIEFEKTSKSAHYPPRTIVVASALFMLTFTFCAILLLFAGNPWAEVITLRPEAAPTRIGIPWLFMAEFPDNRVFSINAGGVVYGMLLSINFILSTAIVGGVRRALR